MDFGSAALSVLIFISGMCINGAQNGLQAYSPAYYQNRDPRYRRQLDAWYRPYRGYPQLHAGRDADAGRAGTLVDLLVLALPACLAGICILLHRMNHAKPRLTEAELDALSSPRTPISGLSDG